MVVRKGWVRYAILGSSLVHIELAWQTEGQKGLVSDEMEGWRGAADVMLRLGSVSKPRPE